MINPFRAIRQFERFLFRSVPEHPESNWQRNTFAHVADRPTGKSQLFESSNHYDTMKGQLIATIIYKHDKEQIEIVREVDQIKNQIQET
jgi:hypothetical protein